MSNTRWFLFAAISLAIGAGCDKGDDGYGSGAGVTAKSAPANPGTAPQPANPPAPTTGAAEVSAVAETPPPGKDAPAPAPSTPDASKNAANAARDSADGVSWEAPAGWSRGGEAPMRLATITDGTAEITINAFPGDVGGITANINRWRNQVGLPAVESPEEAEKLLTDVDVAGRKIRVADLSGRMRTLVAIVPAEGKLYFFKMMGPPDVVAARKDAFDRLVKTIRVE